MDDTSVNFIELVALTRITQDSTVERFGSLINSSFFDASNILATMKQKGLVDFVTAFPAQSTLKITDAGNALIAEANKKGAEPLDALDIAIMTQLSNGRRGLNDLNGSVNVTQRDLALHIFKLSMQQQVSYELANANLNIYLTEKGFLAVRGSSGAAQQPVTQQEEAPQPAQQAGQKPAQGAAAPNVWQGIQQTTNGTTPAQGPKSLEEEMKVIDTLIKKSRARKTRRFMIIGVLIVAMVVLYFVYLKTHGG